MEHSTVLIAPPPLLTRLLVNISLVLYLYVGYYLVRSDFVPLFMSFTVLFFFYMYVCEKQWTQGKVMWLTLAGLGFRAAMLGYIPHLSDDFYRFIWDGNCILRGIDVYGWRPSALAAQFPTDAVLGMPALKQLNSPDYYSLYPPVLQGFFALAVWAVEGIRGQVFALKLMIWLLECGTIAGLWLLLRQRGIHCKNILLYALNPLCILELCGNIHFEAAMIFFMVWAFYFINRSQLTRSAIFMGLAISTKLWPLLFLLFLPRRIGWMRSIRYGMISGGVFLAGFIPLKADLSSLLHMYESMGLYFKTFEFNAGIWYLIRLLGYYVYGWNILYKAYPWLMGAVVSCLVAIMMTERAPVTNNWWRPCMAGLFSYLIFSPVVHPWYITPLCALSVFNGQRAVLYWSWLCWVSYRAYSNSSAMESMGLIFMEYAVVLLWGGYALYRYWLSGQAGMDKKEP